MSGVVYAVGPCIGCRRFFAFNPLSVPSTREITGTSEPICSTCIDAINARRREHALPEWPVAADAYGCAEESAL